MKTNKIIEQHHAGPLNGVGVSQSEIEYHHNQWCVDNGYPVKNYKPQAGRPKPQASSTKVLERQAYIIKFLRNSAKLQAVSIKLQAASSKLLDQ